MSNDKHLRAAMSNFAPRVIIRRIGWPVGARRLPLRREATDLAGEAMWLD
jgi:hypothetical protein